MSQSADLNLSFIDRGLKGRETYKQAAIYALLINHIFVHIFFKAKKDAAVDHPAFGTYPRVPNLRLQALK